MDMPKNLDDMTDLRKVLKGQLALIVALFRRTYNAGMVIVDGIIQYLNDNDGKRIVPVDPKHSGSLVDGHAR